jgi:hypothetical protein
MKLFAQISFGEFSEFKEKWNSEQTKKIQYESITFEVVYNKLCKFR